MEKKLTTNLKDELLKARKEGLNEIRSRSTMQAHGKVLGMDSFSWCDPNFEALITAIKTFPFPVIWIAKHEQVRCALTYYPEVAEVLESVVIYDQANVRFKDQVHQIMNNLIALGSVEEGLRVLPAMIGQKNVMLFTTDQNTDSPEFAYFKSFISH